MFQDIGRVESTAHSTLDDTNLDAGVMEDLKGSSRKNFEFGGSDPFSFIAGQHSFFSRLEQCFGYWPLMYLYTVPSVGGQPLKLDTERVRLSAPVNQVGRSKLPTADSMRMQSCCYVGARRAFSIRAGDVNGPPALRNVTTELSSAMKAQLDHILNMFPMQQAAVNGCLYHS